MNAQEFLDQLAKDCHADYQEITRGIADRFCEQGYISPLQFSAIKSTARKLKREVHPDLEKFGINPKTTVTFEDSPSWSTATFGTDGPKVKQKPQPSHVEIIAGLFDEIALILVKVSKQLREQK